MIDCSESARRLLVCQNRGCRKQGSAEVLAAFERLGQCGSGPMVLVMPDRIWYSAVHPTEVPSVVERHLRGGRPVVSMLYPKYHPPAP
jgi:(2Fe-2S) ferredoxin